jgi:nitroreductase
MQDSVFFKRQSKRSYLDRPVPDDVLRRLFDIIRWTPSCANKQPWRFVVVSDGPHREKLNMSLASGNEWAAAAPLMVALVARESDDYSRDDDPVKYYQFDSGMACLSLLLGAAHEGLMGHPMAGFDAHAVKEALDIPDEYHVMCLVSLGYEGTADLLDELTRAKDEAERTRKPINEIITKERFEF